MSDIPSTPPSSPHDPPTPTPPQKISDGRGRERSANSRTAEAIDASNSLLRTLVSMRADQFLILILLVVMVGFGLLVHNVMRTGAEDRAYQLRHEEDLRTFYSKLLDDSRDKDRMFYNTQREIDRKHCDERENELRKFVHDEREKDRVSLQLISVEMVKWREVIVPMLKKFGGP